MAVDGDPIEVDTRKAIALLAYLAETDEVQRRSTLATLLWPESDKKRGRAALRRTLATLNKALGKEWLDADRTTVALVRGPSLWLDTERFASLTSQCGEGDAAAGDVDCGRCLPLLEEAADLYRGEFLEGFTLYDSAEFDEWQLFQAESWRRRVASTLRLLVGCYRAQKQYEAAIGHARRWVKMDALHEPAHRELMRLYASAGQRTSAVRQYEKLQGLLEEEMGVEPQPETTALYEQILHGEWESQPAVAAGETAPSPPAPTPRLPRRLTSFVGREEELAEIHSLLERPECRLVTILGPGGIGKTRLSLEAAAERQDLYRHGVCFVPLGAVSSLDYLIPAIAEALQFSFYGGGADDNYLKDQLLDYLREKEMLLVLDNFEHVLEGAELLVEILESAPDVQILVTSQERLRLSGEWLVEIYGLECPNGTTVDVESCSAVSLFTQRAGQIHPGFSLDKENKPHVAEICRLVGGLPLGIELASTWVRMLSCQEIARQIERNLDFLAGGRRDAPDRHRSLRAVFEYSWQLLSPQERDVFRKLSVFRGGFEAPAAEAVTGAPLPLLLSLADKSLLQRTVADRFEIPEILRQYAVEKFEAELDEADRREIEGAHRDYYAGFLQAREGALFREGQTAALREIGEEIENVRQAWRSAIVRGDQEAVGRSLNALYHFYEMRSWFQEGAELFGRVATMVAEQDENPLLLGRVLSAQGRLQVRLFQMDEGRETLERSLKILQSLDAEREAAAATSILGVIAEGKGEYVEARQLQQRSLEIWRRTGEQRGVARALIRLGNVSYARGKYEDARAYYGESLTLCRDVGDRRGLALCQNNMGSIADTLGEYEEACRLYRESVAIKRELEDRRGIAYSLNNLGYVNYLRGDYEASTEELTESLMLFREVGDRKGIAYALTNMGNVAYGREEYSEARRLYEESLAVATDVGSQPGMAYALNHLGAVHRQQGSYGEAKASFERALNAATAVQATPIVLEIAVEVAILLAAEAEDNVAEALALLLLALDQSSIREDTRRKAERLYTDLEDRATPALIAAAREAAGTDDPETAIAQALTQASR